MPAYSGKFQYRDESDRPLMQGPCQFSFDAEKCILAPASGTALAFDLGDVDRAVPGELDLQLTLYTGRTLQLRQFGSLFTRMTGEFVSAWRDRTVRCLLLEDLEEIVRATGTAALGAGAPVRAEIRLYKTNLAVLPMDGVPYQWRLAEVDSAVFDDATYSLILRSGAERLVIAKLARLTDEFTARVRAALDGLRTESAGALHDLFPFLAPDQLQRVLTLMPEGRSVRLSALAAVHPELPDALLEHAVDAPLRPYFEALRAQAVADSLMAGFKFIRQDQAAEAAAEEEPPPPESSEAAAAPPVEDEPPAAEKEEEDQQPLFFWFFFPLAEKNGSGGYANVVAWEACTGSGRATYFFRAVAPQEARVLSDPARAATVVDQAVARITRGLALVNFRREPVYLSGESLDQQPKYHRYAIGARKLPDLRALRSAMLGRAIHSSLEKWQAQASALAAR